jgi:hypothetical protein
MTQRMLLAWLTAGAASIAALASGSTLAKEIEHAESRVEISDDGATTRTINRTFEVTSGPPAPLLRKEIEVEVHAEREAGPGRVRIDAWRLPRTPHDRPVYTVSDRGDEVRWLLYPGLLAIQTAACCDSSDTWTIYTASTGRMLLYANGDGEPGFLRRIVHGRSVLLIGVIDEHGGRQPRAFPKYRDGHDMVLVTGADSSSCRNQLVFDLPIPPKVAIYLSDVRWETTKAARKTGLNLDLEKKAPFAAPLRIELSDGRTFTVPVVESGLDSSNVMTPPGATVSPLSPCVL